MLGTRAGFCSLVSISGGQREVPGDWGRGEMTGAAHALTNQDGRCPNLNELPHKHHKTQRH